MKLLFAFLSLLSFTFADVSPQQKQLAELAAAGGGLIQLDQKTFDILTSDKRTWSASIQFTAMDKRRRCAPCNEFDPSWKTVSKAWASASKEHRDNHFFGTLDFDDAPSVFQQLGLASAPVVHVYHPVEGPRASNKKSPATYDFSYGFEALPLAESMSKHTPIPIPYKAPLDYARYATIASAILAFAVMARFIAPVLQSRWTWAAVTILTSLIMTSGYMFTRIRASPYSGGNGNWIAPGYQNQFGQEVQVVALIYGTLAFAFVMLTVIIPYQSSPGRQRVQVYLWNFVIMLVYSVLVTLFRVKNRGYPFKLFL
ncbi:hypothetical protein C8J56DRAFT_955499 [Mycena floridula]|nr:hypothetical protein C8J56DRAFT_955499 [Mycena floridula]